ncbi:Hsp33 family molecular chaperone HslO [Alcanivorax sp. 1008]|uniref:Hsp33 family molecular chaperone HslO n=1 Tax=Alcanivorax sp. 1008 TaxID=2816853 RepID=UPI001D36274E|nr:Hsp33 family molecular chaperone HslO [Alcanivorax sp. 1008]MCC1495829.1 Hsp33 family molecular chaperone HslO [Alcanivorax sp. 1008]
MSQQDQRQRFLFPDSDIRGEIVRLEASVAPVLSARDYPMVVQGLLAESLAAVVLMTGTLKFEGRLSLQAQGNGAVSLLLAEATHDGGIRGLARFSDTTASTEQPHLHELIGDNGVMAITIRPERGSQYQGVVPLEGSSLAACLEDYFRQSEQLPTRLWLAGGNGRAAGLLLQRLPDRIADHEYNAAIWQHVVTLADTLSMEELLDLPAETVLHRLFHETPPQVTAPTPLHFQCTCSRDKVTDTLLSLGCTELQAILHEQGSATISCDFCSRDEHFDRVDLGQLIHQL